MRLYAYVDVVKSGLAALVSVVVAVPFVSACAHSDPGTSSPEQATSQIVGVQAGTSGGNREQDGVVPPNTADLGLQASFQELADTIPGELGIVVAAGGQVHQFGPWSTGPAWSTIKVPLAIAALRHSFNDAKSFVGPAIKRSDNAAAESLWQGLGDPKEASVAVQSVLAGAGDRDTVVQSERIRPEFTAFGQTQWPLTAQAQFAAALPCLKDAADVVQDMNDVANNQQWGLQKYGAAVKGGWGPSLSGKYLVRQMATITTESGHLGVALAAEPEDGQFESGTVQIGRLAEWLQSHVKEFSASACGG